MCGKLNLSIDIGPPLPFADTTPTFGSHTDDPPQAGSLQAFSSPNHGQKVAQSGSF